LITGLRCSSYRDIVDCSKWKLWVAFKESTHHSNDNVISSRAVIHTAGFTKWGADSINQDDSL
jgi:hypothetical protein